jgi:DNA-binding transcriptional LysR family regulator
MEVDELRTFLAIAETGGFSRAGQRLHRSQPAISRRLRQLEEELGAPLFERIRGEVQLTDVGRAFLPHTEAALAALKDGRDAVRELGAAVTGTVSLALVGTLADTHIVDALRRFTQLHKRMRLELRTASSAEVSDLVRRGEATLGLRYFACNRHDLVQQNVGHESMVVVAAPDHRLAGRRVRNPKALASERWVGFPPSRDDRDSSGRVLVRQLVRAA